MPAWDGNGTWDGFIGFAWQGGSGQRALWYHSPSKSSRPSNAGRCTDDRHPDAMTQ